MRKFLLRFAELFLLCLSFILAVPSVLEFAKGEEAIQGPLHVGVTLGERGKHCYYFSAPNDSNSSIIGFYYPNAQVYILEWDSEWCHIYLETEGYMKTTDLLISEKPGQILSNGYAFSSFSSNDPDVDPNDFIELRVDCDRSKPGDAVGYGEAFEFVDYVGDMLQVRRGSYNGFIPSKFASVISTQEIFTAQKNQPYYGERIYRAGVDIPSGVYHVTAESTVGSLVLVKNTGERSIYELERLRERAFTIFIPTQITVDVPLGCRLMPIQNHQQFGRVFSDGRYLCGIDLAGYPDTSYVLTADEVEDAYYIKSNLLNDQRVVAGTRYELLPGQRLCLYLFAGEYIELFHCRIEERKIGG